MVVRRDLGMPEFATPAPQWSFGRMLHLPKMVKIKTGDTAYNLGYPRLFNFEECNSAPFACPPETNSTVDN